MTAIVLHAADHGARADGLTPTTNQLNQDTS
jgi:hypothetical protein